VGWGTIVGTAVLVLDWGLRFDTGTAVLVMDWASVGGTIVGTAVLLVELSLN
jgi:hypothetical protein